MRSISRSLGRGMSIFEIVVLMHGLVAREAWGRVVVTEFVPRQTQAVNETQPRKARDHHSSLLPGYCAILNSCIASMTLPLSDYLLLTDYCNIRWRSRGVHTRSHHGVVVIRRRNLGRSRARHDLLSRIQLHLRASKKQAT